MEIAVSFGVPFAGIAFRVGPRATAVDIIGPAAAVDIFKIVVTLGIPSAVISLGIAPRTRSRNITLVLDVPGSAPAHAPPPASRQAQPHSGQTVAPSAGSGVSARMS